MFARSWSMLRSHPLAAIASGIAVATIPAITRLAPSSASATVTTMAAASVTPVMTDAPKATVDDTSLPSPKVKTLKKSKKSKKAKKSSRDDAANESAKKQHHAAVAEKAAKLHAAGWEDESIVGSEPCAWSADQMLRPYGARNISQDELQPRLVMIVHRHGARSPIAGHQGQTLEEFRREWAGQCTREPDGTPIECNPGELTRLGKQQLEFLGIRLRDRYAAPGHRIFPETELTPADAKTASLPSIIPLAWDPAAIHVRTTDVVRTRLSSRYLLQGMFPEASVEDISKSFTHKHQSIEDMIPNHPDCLRVRELMNENKQSPAFQRLHNDPHFAQLRKVISEKYNDNKELPTWIVLTDPWKCRAVHGMPLPSHVDDQLVKTAYDAATAEFDVLLSGEELARTGMGKFSTELTNRLSDRAAGKNAGLKLAVYGGHDTTLLPLAKALRVGGETWPSFAGSFVFELLENIKYDSKSTAPVAPFDPNGAPTCSDSYINGRVTASDATISTSQWHVRVLQNEKCVWAGPLTGWQQRQAHLVPPADDPHLINACLFKGTHRPKGFQW